MFNRAQVSTGSSIHLKRDSAGGGGATGNPRTGNKYRVTAVALQFLRKWRSSGRMNETEASFNVLFRIANRGRDTLFLLLVVFAAMSAGPRISENKPVCGASIPAQQCVKPSVVFRLV
ncbi:hypothetical protein PBY51_008322 [Eleginops maclovinus]|uniref:Uncharacterized protein n=1 Tax=Eleginops maclovinus TaxID=56733 RepID=A0AAN7X9I4_ELEMC|nr:hypothetical protein PBY51_008322 [Eleginops maclovinus]